MKELIFLVNLIFDFDNFQTLLYKLLIIVSLIFGFNLINDGTKNKFKLLRKIIDLAIIFS